MRYGEDNAKPIFASDIQDGVVKNIYADDRGTLHVIDNRNCETWLDTGVALKDELEIKLKEIEKNYENQLQRQKVHISRGDRITGHRVHGRNRKVAIPKRCFRNSQGIKGMPTAT